MRASWATAEAIGRADHHGSPPTHQRPRRRLTSMSAHVFDTGTVTSSEYRNTVQPDTVPSGNPGGPIPVIARLVCADGLEEWWPARAVQWTATDVLIGFEAEPGNSRSLRYLWLRVDDVARVIRPAPAANGQ